MSELKKKARAFIFLDQKDFFLKVHVIFSILKINCYLNLIFVKYNLVHIVHKIDF